jgi:hypothetical protein
MAKTPELLFDEDFSIPLVKKLFRAAGMTQLSRRRVLVKEQHFSVIMPEDGAAGTPLFCPVCKFAMREPGDPLSYFTFRCCSHCATKFAEPNREKWLKGWRPNPDDVAAYVTARNNVPFVVSW